MPCRTGRYAPAVGVLLVACTLVGTAGVYASPDRPQPASLLSAGQEDGATTQYLEIEGGRLAYDDTGGSGPLVVMVSGLGDLRQEYRFVTGPLREAGYRVVTMDLRGHGESSVGWASYNPEAVGADIVALIERLRAGPAFIIGNSFAGGAAVWAAVEDPAAVRGLVLIGPSVHDLPTSFFMQALIWVMFAGPWRNTAWLSYFASLYPTRKPADFAEYRARLGANLAEPGRMDALTGMLYSSRAAVEERLGAVKAPALVLMGSKDQDFPKPEEEAAWIAQRLRGVYHMVPDAGHYPHAEMPEVVLPQIQSFFEANGR